MVVKKSLKKLQFIKFLKVFETVKKFVFAMLPKYLKICKVFTAKYNCFAMVYKWFYK